MTTLGRWFGVNVDVVDGRFRGVPLGKGFRVRYRGPCTSAILAQCFDHEIGSLELLLSTPHIRKHPAAVFRSALFPSAGLCALERVLLCRLSGVSLCGIRAKTNQMTAEDPLTPWRYPVQLEAAL